MNAIIYSSLSTAQTALAKCESIEQGAIENVGEGLFTVPIPKPYTFILTHPGGDRFALIADAQVEAKLKKTAVALGDDWFSNSFLLTQQDEAQND